MQQAAAERCTVQDDMQRRLSVDHVQDDKQQAATDDISPQATGTCKMTSNKRTEGPADTCKMTSNKRPLSAAPCKMTSNKVHP